MRQNIVDGHGFSLRLIRGRAARKCDARQENDRDFQPSSHSSFSPHFFPFLTARSSAAPPRTRRSSLPIVASAVLYIEVVFDVVFPEGEAGDAARTVLPVAITKSHDRLCTVSRTVELGTPIDTH